MTAATLIPLDVEAIRVPTNEDARALLESIEAANGARSGTGPSGIKALAKRKSDIFHVPLVDIQIDPEWNVRDFSDPENQQHVVDLAHSIAALGKVVDPITVVMRDGELYEWDGESRLRAVWYAINELHARIETVPCVTEPDAKTDEERLARMFAKEMGKRFKPMERARLAKRLLDRGWDVPRIAAATGLTEMRVNQLLALLEMPEEVQQQVASGVVSATLAAEIVQQHGDEAPAIVERAAEIASDNGGKKNGRATAATVRKATTERRAGAFGVGVVNGVPTIVEEDENDLSSALETQLVENQRLREQLEQLSVTDHGRTIAGLQAQNAALNTRIQTLTQEVAMLKSAAKYKDATLEKLRGLLGVDANGELEGAIRDLMK